MKRTGQSKIAVVGWGRGMGHKGHMYLASSVITQAKKMKADPYFFVSKTVGKDDPIYPEEKVSIYQKVFPQYAPIFQPQGNLNQALQELVNLGYQGVVVVVGADQKQAFQYLERPNKEGVPVYQSMGLQKLRVISRQETGDSSAELEGPRATPMREVLLHPDATEEQKFKVWRDAMPEALGDEEVMQLMKKAEARLMGSVKKQKIKEFVQRMKPMLEGATPAQKQKVYEQLSKLKSSLNEAGFDAAEFNRHMDRLRAREELRKTDPMRALVGDLIDKENAKRAPAKKPEDDSMSINDPRHPSYGVLHNPLSDTQLDEFAPGNGDDGLPYAEYQVYQCDPNDQFEWIGGPLYQTDNMGMAHKYAYEKYIKHRPKAFMVWQERSQGSRGNYGVKGESDGTEEINEFAPDGFNGGDDGEEFNPRMAKMAQEEGFIKGVSLADPVTVEMALKINQWDTHDGGIYKQHFAKGFIAGRKNKINHDNKQYNLNLKLMKDGSVVHGKQLDEFAPDGFDGFEDDNRVPMHFVVEKDRYNRRSKWKKSRDADGVILFATKQQAIQAAEKYNKLDPNREFAYGGTQMVHVDDDDDLDEGIFGGLGGPASGPMLAKGGPGYAGLSGAKKLRHDAHVALQMVDSLKHTNHNGYYDEEIKKKLLQAKEYLAKAKELEQGLSEGYGEDDGIHMGAKVYHRSHQNGEPFTVTGIIDDQRVNVVDDFGNKKVLFIDELVPAEGLDESLKGKLAAAALGAAALGGAGNAHSIAGAFPTPSAQQAMYKAAADSNRAEAKRQAELQKKADAERLQKNTELVDKEQRINHHLLPTNEVSDKTLVGYLKGVEADSRKNKADPTKRSPEKANKSVKGFQTAFNKLDSRKPDGSISEDYLDE